MAKFFLVPFSVCCEWYLKLTFCYCVFRLLFLASWPLYFQGVRPFSSNSWLFYCLFPFKNRSSAIVSLPFWFLFSLLLSEIGHLPCLWCGAKQSGLFMKEQFIQRRRFSQGEGKLSHLHVSYMDFTSPKQRILDIEFKTACVGYGSSASSFRRFIPSVWLLNCSVYHWIWVFILVPNSNLIYI